MLILTGPTAAGKNTVGATLARGRGRCAVIDFDVVRTMFARPHRAPWEGAEGRAQQLLGVQLVCGIARGFAADGWEVVILDVLSDETLALYRQLLGDSPLAIVQLLPDWSELRRRFEERGPCLTAEELAEVYLGQLAFAGYDLRLDNTALSPAQVVERIGYLL